MMVAKAFLRGLSNFRGGLSPERRVLAERSGLTAAGWFFAGFIGGMLLLGLFHGLLPRIAIPLPVAFLVCAYVGAESVMHRMGWWRRKLRPQLWIWWGLAIGLGGVAVIALIVSAAEDITLLLRVRQLTGLSLTDIILGDPDVEATAFRVYLDALALIACGGLFYLTPMPRRWADFDRYRLFLLAVATVVGRPAAGSIFDVMTATPGSFADLLRLVVGPLLLPFCGAIVLAIVGLLVALLVIVVFAVLVSLPLLAFDLINQHDINAEVRAQKKAALESYLLRFDRWLRGNLLPALPNDSKGARFSTLEEIARAGAGTGMAFGHHNDRPLLLDTDKHVLLMASTRSGKGVTVIIPHLLRHQGSAFILDPKGENARATGRQRTALNDVVHYLDPFGISGQPLSRFNPLASFTPENMEAASKAMAAALILDAKRDHWTAAGQQLLAGIILHVVTSETIEPEFKDLVTVRRMLLGAVKETLEEMRASAAADGLVADLAASFLNTPEKEFGSIASTAQRETEILDNPYIAACLSAAGDAPEVDFADWRRGTMSVFLCLSAPKFPIFNRWLRLVLTAALDEMTDQLEPPPQPVCFMLDELATLGHMASIENAIGLAAGYGIQLVTVFQDIAQLKDLYKGRWASFVGNAGVRALFSIQDYDTARYWSDFMGGRLVETKSETQDIYGITQGQSAGETSRPLLSPEEIMLRYADDRMLVLKQGLRPVETERVPYWQDASLNGLWDDPRIRPRPARPAAPKGPVLTTNWGPFATSATPANGAAHHPQA